MKFAASKLGDSKFLLKCAKDSETYWWESDCMFEICNKQSRLLRFTILFLGLNQAICFYQL